MKGDPEIDVSKIDAALLDGSDLSHEQQDQVSFSQFFFEMNFFGDIEICDTQY